MKLFSVAVPVVLACLLVVGLAGIADGQAWAPMTNAPPVSFGAMLLLTDGRVLLHEESNCNTAPDCVGLDYTAWFTLTPDINGSYINGTFTQVASLPNGYAPLFFGSAVLADGKVVVQGGEYQCAQANCVEAFQNLGALYDPVANTWTATTPPFSSTQKAIGDSESVVLPNGTWMLAACCAKVERVTTFPDYFYFNESTLSFTTEASATDGETTEFDESGFNLLPNGQVMMIDVYNGAYNATAMGSSLYNPATNTWTSGGSTAVQLWDSGCGKSSGASYELGPVMLMPNGTLFATGASDCQAGNTATYNLATGVWTAQAPFPNSDAANDAPGATEINGNAIVITSPFTGTFSTPATVYEWNGTSLTPATGPGSFPNIANANIDPSYVGHLLVLPTGQILFTDNTTDGMEILTSAGTYQPAWQPTISSGPSSLTLGQTYPISGTQFNGVTTGAAYGDDFQDNTNYPLVQIVNNATSHVFYARTHGHSTMGVQTGSMPVSTNFDVPVTMEQGPCELYVVANGIPSAPSDCNVAAPQGIYSPVSGSTLTSNSVTFLWGANSNATAYWLDIGSTQGGKDYYSSGSLSSSTLSLTVTTLPNNGSTVWVRWYSLVSGVWQPTDYSYTAVGGANSLGAITSPVAGSALTSAAPTFIWSFGTGATAYWLDIGSAPGGTNYFSSGNLGPASTVATTGLPNNGTMVFATLHSLVGGSWFSNSYTYTAFTAPTAGPVMSTPTPGSTLTSGTTTFTWAALTGVTSYWLDAGSSAGAHDYFSSGVISKNTRTSTVKTLPTNGSTVYITLYGLVSGTYLPSPYQYTSVNTATAGGIMQTPTIGSVLTGSSVTFTWSAGSAATAYWIDVGSTTGGHNYASTGNLGNVLTTTVNGLPTDGSMIYVTLYSLIGGVWNGNTYNYTAFNATGGLAAMISPTPSTTLSTNQATFSWSSDTNATGYWLDIGTAPDGNTIYSSGNLGTAQSTTVFSLPANGSTIYVTLYSLVGGQWLNNSYMYVSGP